jgi:hypothetical protein
MSTTTKTIEILREIKKAVELHNLEVEKIEYVRKRTRRKKPQTKYEKMYVARMRYVRKKEAQGKPVRAWRPRLKPDELKALTSIIESHNNEHSSIPPAPPLPNAYICEHNKQKYHCKECNGSQICLHGIYKYICRPCHGKGICQHDKQKSRCKFCKLAKQAEAV